MGNRRSDIMDNCPADFVDDLKDFLDEVEEKVNEAQALMNISSLADLSMIDDAHDLLIDLSQDLS